MLQTILKSALLIYLGFAMVYLCYMFVKTIIDDIAWRKHNRELKELLAKEKELFNKFEKLNKQKYKIEK